MWVDILVVEAYSNPYFSLHQTNMKYFTAVVAIFFLAIGFLTGTMAGRWYQQQQPITEIIDEEELGILDNSAVETLSVQLQGEVVSVDAEAPSITMTSLDDGEEVVLTLSELESVTIQLSELSEITSEDRLAWDAYIQEQNVYNQQVVSGEISTDLFSINNEPPDPPFVLEGDTLNFQLNPDINSEGVRKRVNSVITLSEIQRGDQISMSLFASKLPSDPGIVAIEDDRSTTLGSLSIAAVLVQREQ